MPMLDSLAVGTVAVMESIFFAVAPASSAVVYESVGPRAPSLQGRLASERDPWWRLELELPEL
jgi:hypothetical protein